MAAVVRGVAILPQAQFLTLSLRARVASPSARPPRSASSVTELDQSHDCSDSTSQNKDSRRRREEDERRHFMFPIVAKLFAEERRCNDDDPGPSEQPADGRQQPKQPPHSSKTQTVTEHESSVTSCQATETTLLTGRPPSRLRDPYSTRATAHAITVQTSAAPSNHTTTTPTAHLRITLPRPSRTE